ncbi:MAG: ArsR/SmtB family transcription factor [Rhodomicrobium sp.]
MTAHANVAEIAALIGDPGRANMLAALMSGEALTATEFAAIAGVSRPSASEHLAKLTQGNLLCVTSQGRHRYYRLASASVARMLESIMTLAAGSESGRRATPRIDPALREARTCYDHLAGRLGVGLADALIARGAVILTADSGELTASGRDLLDSFGVSLEAPAGTKRLLCRPCLDWTERRPHIGGRLGVVLYERISALGWIERGVGRAVAVTPAGRRGLAHAFGFDF